VTNRAPQIKLVRGQLSDDVAVEWLMARNDTCVVIAHDARECTTTATTAKLQRRSVMPFSIQTSLS